MFVFMGLMLDRSGVAENLMTNFVKVFGRLRGGLAITVVIIGLLLAASTGIVGASVVLLCMLSFPIMLEHGYSQGELAAGVVAGAGTLGILIPPSIMLVIMADQLSLSVGDLFMGAVVPGVMLGAHVHRLHRGARAIQARRGAGAAQGPRRSPGPTSAARCWRSSRRRR